jgi:hypothetical protein
MRGQRVRPYLGYYLGLGEDDRCSISENSPLLHHLTTQEEELSDIGDISFKRLSTQLGQSIKGGFEDLALFEVGSIVARVSTLHA